MGLILDTTFVIAFEREAKRKVKGAAAAVLEKHAAESVFLTFTVAGELACGNSAADLQVWRRLCRPFAMLPWSLDVSWKYGEIYRSLSAKGTLIGTNELWIAATALVHGMPAVTNNESAFKRVDGPTVITF